ncbi:MAG: hypothetical protein FWG42_04820 [Clostridiales bacterium]|nr:hypothetical protein [Clostridiales bacterium]
MAEIKKEMGTILKELEAEGLRADAGKKLISAAQDPAALFEENPMAMMRTVRFAAESGFDIHIKTYDAILEKAALLKDADVDRTREEFEKILVAEFAGKGLKMLAGTELMPCVIGGLAEKMTKRAMKQFAVLAENIDKTKRVRDRRVVLFYLCFEEKAALGAVKFLGFDARTAGLVADAMRLLEPMCFLANEYELKRFVFRCGEEKYRYLDSLSKAQRIVYDMPDVKILGRHYMMELIKSKGDPIFIEDLAVDADDIVCRNIAEGDKADQILLELLDMVHKDPKLNTREHLLRQAESYSKNVFRMPFQKMRWLK